jgi:membrane protein
MAYYFFFSLFPIFLFLAPLLSLLGDRQKLFDTVIGSLAQAVPGEAYDLLREVVAEVVFAEGAPGLMSIGLLLAAWAGSNVFNGLIIALNKAYGVKEMRPFWKRRLIALAALAGSGVIVGLATVVMLGGEDVVRWLSDQVGIGGAARSLWIVLQYPIAISLLVGLAWCIYYFLPNVRQERKHVLTGAIVATVLWILVTLVFRFYVQNFGDYNKTYGTIGGVIVLLTWMYLSMMVILVGGELNAELHVGTGAVNPKRGILLGGRIATGAGPRVTSDAQDGRVEPLAAQGPEQH